MKITQQFALLALLVTAAFSSASAQNDFTYEYPNQKAVDAIEGEKLLIADPYIRADLPDDFIGNKVLEIYGVTSNYDKRFFRGKMTIALEEPLSKEIVEWAGENDGALMFFAPVDKGTSTVYRIVGHAKDHVAFQPTLKLFPEFADISLIDFSDKKTMKKWKKKALVAGGWMNDPFGPKREPNAIELVYPSWSIDGHVTYMALIYLEEPLSKAMETYIRVHHLGDLVFEMVSPSDNEESAGVYRLVGYSKDKFTFAEKGEVNEEELKKQDPEFDEE